MKKYLFWLLPFLAFSCQDSAPPGALFREVPRSQTGIDFRNLVIEKETFNIFKYQYFYNGGGVAVGDFNNDGLQDLVFTGNMVKNRLYLNQGDLQFKDVTKASGIAEKEGWCTGVTTVDINQDGWLDLYICRAGYPFDRLRTNLLFINDGDRASSGSVSFTESAAEYQLDDVAHTTQASFFDYDKDGDLDLFLLNHSTVEYSRGSLDIYQIRNKENPSFTNKLLRNDKGTFVNVTAEAGITSNVLSFSLGLSNCDINQDGWPDIFVANDFNESDYLFINQRDGTFREELARRFDHTSLFSMGCDIADINGDALPDLVSLDMLPEGNYLQKMHSGADNFDKVDLMRRRGFFKQYSRNMLQLNNGDGTFSETGQQAGISNTDWSWASLFFDFDNDGRCDLFISNGYPRDHTNMDFLKFTADEVLRMQQGEENIGFEEYLEKMPPIIESNYFYQNDGAAQFTNRAADWGLAKPVVTQSAAWVDLDNDGDLDLALNNTNEYAGVLENLAEQNPQNHWLRIQLKGNKANPDGIGAKLYAWSGDQVFYLEQNPVRGFQATMDPVLHLGLGAVNNLDSLLLIWPTNEKQLLTNVKANQSLELNLKDASARHNYLQTQAATIFEPTEQVPAFQHQENRHVDFNDQQLLPWFYSRQGPALAHGDLNGDGLDDLYCGGAKGQFGQVFLQSPNGGFAPVETPAFAADAGCEDTDACFVDVDGDKDLDLYVVSGGYEFEANAPALQDRLYLNNGKGGFTASTSQLPELKQAGSCIEPADIDGDGDFDFFVGGAFVPGRFPLMQAGKILINDGKGQFALSDAAIPDGQQGLWLDLDGDRLPELITAGEWAPLRVYKNQQGAFSEKSDSYFPFDATGLWYSLHAADLDADGDLDILAGNLGTNTQLKVKAGEPLDIWYDDFDQNGSIDPLLFYYLQGGSYPAASMEDLTSQLPYLRKKFNYFEDYANAQVGDILTAGQIKAAGHKQAAILKTVWFENVGGRFEMHTLPKEAQIAPVFAIETVDVNSDGLPDILLAGNQSMARVKFGSLDGNHGQLLLNTAGKKQANPSDRFQFIPYSKTGLNIRDDVRSLNVINISGNAAAVFGVNDKPVRIYKLGRKAYEN